jgi:hypothetical protein
MSENRALLDAVRSGDAPGVLRCLDDGASIALRDGKGCGALFHTVFQRQWAVVDTLLARGADIDLPEHRGWWWCLPFTCGSPSKTGRLRT